MKPLLTFTRGSDITIDFSWTGYNLSFHTGEVFESEGFELSRATLTITNAASGAFRVEIEGTNPISVGIKSFRFRFTPTGGKSTAPELFVFEVV
jgi:hypothetical protein